MLVTRKEIMEFKKVVCSWLKEQGIDLTNLIIEGHTDVDGYVICWNKYNHEHIVFNMDEWGQYQDENNKDIRKATLETLGMKMSM